MGPRWLVIGLGAVLVLSGCSGSSAPNAPSTQVIRGLAVTHLSCDASSLGSPRNLRPEDASEIRLCPLHFGPAPERGTTISLGAPEFAPLVAALAAPDQHAAPGTACPAYADLPQRVLATSPAGPLLVHIPVDGCGHYLPAAASVLNKIRAESVLPSQG